MPLAPPAPVHPTQRVVREDENSVIVHDKRYTKLECVGRGGSSKVYKVRASVPFETNSSEQFL